MPAEQRIIGGGLLIAGVAVVLILLYVFSWGGLTPQEGYEKVLNELYPRYVEARGKQDYLQQKRVAEEVQQVLGDAGTAAVSKILQGDAAAGKAGAKECLDLIEKGNFGKAAEGLYAFDGGFFKDETHRALTHLRRAVEEDLKVLRTIRATARDARQALADAREGAQAALALPEPKLVAEDAAPIVSPNPVYLHDAELFRVFGLKPSELDAALATPDPGAGSARSARLRWNNAVPSSGLAGRVRDVPVQAASLRLRAADLLRQVARAGEDPAAKEVLAAWLARAAEAVGAGLEGPEAEAFREHKEKFATGPALVSVMSREADMLEAYKDHYGALADAFAKSFPG